MNHWKKGRNKERRKGTIKKKRKRETGKTLNN
jgi:hypothetical protein